jgi:Flp pilus assembly protein TadG
MSGWHRRGGRGRQRGQALVEFALVLFPLLLMLLGTFDIGRGIYLYNAVAEATREVARATSVHVGSPTGSSTQTAAVVAKQKSLIPRLSNATFSCVDLDGTANGHQPCQPGDGVKVSMSTPFSLITPLLSSFLGPYTFTSSSTIQISGD